MAPHNGIVATTSGNAIVYGDTNGAAFRGREISELHDLLVITFDKDGTKYTDINRSRPPTPQPTPLQTLPPIPAPTPDVEPQPTPIQAVDVPLAPVGIIPNTTMQTKEGMSPVAIAFLVLGILVILAIPSWWFLSKRRPRRSKTLDDKIADMEMMEQQGLTSDAKRDGIFSGVNNRFYDDPLKNNVSELSTKGGEVI